MLPPWQQPLGHPVSVPCVPLQHLLLSPALFALSSTFCPLPFIPVQLQSPGKWLYSLPILIPPWIPRAPQTICYPGCQEA